LDRSSPYGLSPGFEDNPFILALMTWTVAILTLIAIGPVLPAWVLTVRRYRNRAIPKQNDHDTFSRG
jgi:uncharacterized membrane protein YhaH (DUF805 family)